MNARPVRQYDIRNLASLFVIEADEPLKTACRAALEAFPKNLPFEFESQKKNKACKDHLRRNAEFWLEFGKKENYAAVPAKDGSGSFIILQNPRSGDADVVESARRWKEMNDHCDCSCGLTIASNPAKFRSGYHWWKHFHEPARWTSRICFKTENHPERITTYCWAPWLEPPRLR
jgi:hypothetical protein